MIEKIGKFELNRELINEKVFSSSREKLTATQRLELISSSRWENLSSVREDLELSFTHYAGG